MAFIFTPVELAAMIVMDIAYSFNNAHIMPFYKNKYGLKKEDFPVSYNNYLKSLSIPIYPGLTEEQVNYIIESIIEIGKESYKG